MSGRTAADGVNERFRKCPSPTRYGTQARLLGGGTLGLCQGPRPTKGPRATAMIAATDDKSIYQSNSLTITCIALIKG